MATIAPARQEELLITRGGSDAAARAAQRRAQAGELARIAEGVYLFEHTPDAQAAVVRRNWARILGALVPKAVVSYRSAYAGGLTDDVIYLSHPTRYNRTIKLPGLHAVLVKGAAPQAGDMPLGSAGLYFASRERQLLENLSQERGEHGKSAGARAVEERLVSILGASGEAGLNKLRDRARPLAEPLGLKKEFNKLDGLIGALLATHATGVLKTKDGRRVAQGTPVDAARMGRFETLAARLRVEALPHRNGLATTEPSRSNFAFLEAYFSNYVEGTEFAIEEARDIALKGRIVERRPKDSHDVLGVFKLALQSPTRDTLPPFGHDFPTELARRHALMLEMRPEVNPGHFKLDPNRAGNTWFVEPNLVRGTLIEGSNLARSVPEGLARAIYYAFLVSELHPFNDGNGRIARLIMNAELSRVDEARIIIPTLFHEEYVDCQRQLTQQNAPTGHIRALSLIQRWTIGFDYSHIDRLIDAVKRTNALERSRSQYKLTMPDGSPLT
ncbi:MAG TPA: Fic family protein [Burkholderiales bacterium]|nr:Fic family protein [Burkholderiales bacterium]